MDEQENKKIRNFGDLEIWKRGIEIVKGTYGATRSFPRHEIFGLSGQMQRSAISIPSSVAAGFNRLHNRECQRFLYIALGSCAELETQIEITAELNHFASDGTAMLLETLGHETRMIRNLLTRLD
jgi:four helix bundle protein